MVKSQKITEFGIVFIFSVVLMFLLRNALLSRSVLWMLPLLAIVGVAFAFSTWKVLAAWIFGTCWYLGGSPFLESIPYSYFLMFAVLGATVINQCMKRMPEVRVRRVSFLTVTSVVMIMMIVGIYTTVTYLKFKGRLDYGVPGGLKFAFQYLLVMFFVIWNSLGKIPNYGFDKIPMIAFGVATFKMLVDLLNFLIPQSVYVTYYITTNLNFEVRSVLLNSAESALRVTGFREFGLYGLFYLMSGYCNQVKQNKGEQMRVRFLILIALCGLIIMYSGFRGYMIRYAFCLLIFFWIYNLRFFIGTLVGGMIVWGGVVAMGSAITVFPLTIQRVLGALPGVYKTEVAYDAFHGIEWRAELRRRFFTTEFWHHPWFGRGQTGDMEEEFINIQSSTDMLYFEISQMWHSGWVSTLDVVGIIGCFCLISLQVITLFACWRLLGRYRYELEGWMLWAIMFFFAQILIFWYTSFFQNDFPIIALSAVLVWIAYDKVALSTEEDRGQQKNLPR